MKKNARRLSTREYIYTVLYKPEKEGGYGVSVPLLPGLITYGRTFEEARIMARDAIQCHVEAIAKDLDEIPSEYALLEEKISVRV